MKYFLIVLIVIVAFSACSINKKSKTKTSTLSVSKNYWQKVQNIDVLEKYSAYKVFTLDKEKFKDALQKGIVDLPDDMGNIYTFNVEDSQVMSEELAKKFPDIKTYKGEQTDNSLCKPRIETNKNKIKIAVFCNDKTYFIDQDKELGVFIVYNKQNVPKGTGIVKE